MAEWQHVWASRGYAASVCIDHAEDAPPCGCTTPTPDPASPCGFEGCLIPPGKPWHVWADDIEPDALHHKRIPSRCLCGHALVPA